jgi:eukaryotic-like serine/threonine-protein kinase
VTIEAGTELAGRYRVVRHLGTGGMASVWLAEDGVLGREVAVKRVHAAPDSESGRRIVREARLGATLSHAALVPVFDIVPDGDALLLVMEYVAGETLADALKRGPMSPPRALAVLRPLADALDYAHSKGVVHRDVKPANILLRGDGAVKLADLGVATSEEVTQITRTGGLLGTVAYMAPEQFEPGPVTPAVDVYALASVAFEMLAGRRAHQAQSPLELMGQIREAPRPDLAEARPGTPPAAAEALQRGLARRPEDRPHTAGTLVDELEAAFGTKAPPPPRDDPPTERMTAIPPSPPAEPTPEPGPEPHADAEAPPEATPTPAPVGAPVPPPVEQPDTAPAGVAASTARPRRSSQGRTRGLVGGLLALLLVGVVLVALLSGGGDDEDPPSDRAGTTATQSTKGTQAEEQAPATPPRADATPESAVRAFYERAADGDYDGAWNLAGPRFRAEFGSRAGLEDTLGSLRSIEFQTLEETARSGRTATVRIATVAEHSTRTDRCTGTLQTVRRGDGWRVEPQAVKCTTDP